MGEGGYSMEKQKTDPKIAVIPKITVIRIEDLGYKIFDRPHFFQMTTHCRRDASALVQSWFEW